MYDKESVIRKIRITEEGSNATDNEVRVAAKAMELLSKYIRR